MKKLFSLSLVVCAYILFGCMSNGDETVVLPELESDDVSSNDSNSPINRSSSSRGTTSRSSSSAGTTAPGGNRIQGASYSTGTLPTGTAGQISVTINSSSIVSGGATTLTVTSDKVLTELYVQFAGVSGYYKISILPSYLSSTTGGYTYIVPLQFSQNLLTGSGDTESIQMSFSGSTGSATTSSTTKSIQAVKVGSGALQIALSWDKAVDLDLYVTTPSGRTIYFSNPTVGNGTLDHDDQCMAGNENVFFTTPLVDGDYFVDVDLYDRCDVSSTSAIKYIVSAYVNGNILTFSSAQNGEFSSGVNYGTNTIGTIRIQNGQVVY